MTIEQIIKNHILKEIFNEFPTDIGQHPFDFFMTSDVDCTEFVSFSPLGTEWGYEVCEQYREDDSIRKIRGLMQSMYSDLERLKTSLFQYAVKSVVVSKDDFTDENEFYGFVQKTNATLHRQGTADEYATVLTVDAEAVL
jgi:hypothetical protein